MASSSTYRASITGLSLVCFALSVGALCIPIWGYFDDNNGSFGSDHGYFGPWKVCKELTYDRTKCGSSENVSRFRPSHFVLASGITIAVTSFFLAIYCVIAIIQIVSINARERFSMSKFVLSALAAATTLATAGMFAFQTDDIRRGFRVTWGISFYMVIVAVILTILLAAMSFSDHQILRQSRRVSTQRKGSFNRKHSEI